MFKSDEKKKNQFYLRYQRPLCLKKINFHMNLFIFYIYFFNGKGSVCRHTFHTEKPNQ